MNHIQKVYRMSNYRVKWWQRWLLNYVDFETWDSPQTHMKFKMLFGSMFIYEFQCTIREKIVNPRGLFN